MKSKKITVQKKAVIEENIIREAINILESRHTRGTAFTSPEDTKSYCRLKLGAMEHEVFGVMFLDNKHRLIDFKEMFRGTIDSASVYPREIVKEALACNAAAMVLTHNHPSGDAEPSAADRAITAKIKAALALVDIRVLDHIVVSRTETRSFAEFGMM
jgi:DNA repair protein RadC